MEPQEHLHLGNALKKIPRRKQKRNRDTEEPEHKELHMTKNRASRWKK